MERGQDVERSTLNLVAEGERPLTDDERKAADRDTPVGERVYAPASERVPKTVEGHRDVIEHPDNATPERQAAGQVSDSSDTEPTFTRVPRPNTGPYQASTDQYISDSQTGADSNRWMSNMSTGSLLPFGLGWMTLLAGGVGVWLWMRWRRERNKPLNRLRRQARQTAAQARQRAFALREQMPEIPEFPEDATRPAVGVGTALLSVAVVLWQQWRARSRSEARTRDVRKHAGKASKHASKMGRKAADTVSELDWQQRLMALRELWTPGRVELEKVSIPRR